MIVSSLRGGLGNQMFIYAMVKAMALRNNVPFAFNLNTDFANDEVYKRKLLLSYFALDLPENKKLTFDFSYGNYYRRLSRNLGCHILHPSYRYICEERPPHFESRLISSKITNAFLEGYWQSEKYFLDYKQEIKESFVIQKKLECASYLELEEIKLLDKNAIMIGVRRYQETDVAPGGVLEANYYKCAMDIMASKVTSPVFFCFSQDLEWVEKHLAGKYPVRLISKKEDDSGAIDDMFLMMHFRNYIISNSSFYWWGAWLSKYDDKLVIAPGNFINKDSVPESWFKLNVR